MDDKKVVLIKTHVWSNEFEKYMIKIKKEVQSIGVDFYILMHDEKDEIYNKVNDPELRLFVLKFKEEDIKKIYNEIGYYTIWLSNHWILMWFYRQFKDKYQYYWSIEYDARIVGDSTIIWGYKSNLDFIFPMGNIPTARNYCWENHIVGGEDLKNIRKFYGFLQIARYSNKFLNYLNQCYENGENGQDELITFTLLNRGRFTASSLFLNSMIKGKWTWQDKYITPNRQLYKRLETYLTNYHMKGVFIFHPIKPLPDL